MKFPINATQKRRYHSAMKPIFFMWKIAEVYKGRVIPAGL